MNPEMSGEIALPPHISGATQLAAKLADNPWARTATPGAILGLLIWLVIHLQGMQAEINSLQIWRATHTGEHTAAEAMYKRELEHWRETRSEAYRGAGLQPPPREP